MKNLIITLAVLIGINTYAQNPKKDNSSKQNQPYFEKIVTNAISEAFKNKDIDFIDVEIKKVKEDEGIPNSYRNYWTSYLLYYKAIYYKNFLQDDSKASKTIDKSIELIEDNLSSSEDYALYAMNLSYSIQFANMFQISKISSQVNENAEKALSLNKKNLRAYYVLASQNFHTPKMFGGMQKVKEYVSQGLSCPDSTDSNYYAPQWGRLYLYKILKVYYEDNGDEEKRNGIEEKMKEEFPNKF